jgi:D-amino peptidase
MKIYVCCDLEGTAGVVDHCQQCWFDGAYYLQARRLATLELNALVEGALEGGATEVIAWDGHGNFPGGLDIDLLHPGCRMVMGAGDGSPAGLDRSFDALFQLGLHGMAGARRGVLAHSFMGHIAEIQVNGMPWGEIAMNMQTAGQVRAPCVFLAGDWAAAEEAKLLAPGIETAVVKEGLAEVGSLRPAPMISLAPERARAIIRETACRAMSKIGCVAPFKVAPPFQVRTRFVEAKYADQVMTRPGVIQIDELTVQKDCGDEIDLLI